MLQSHCIVRPPTTHSHISNKLNECMMATVTFRLFWNVLLRIDILSLSVGSEMHSSRNRSCSAPSSLFNVSQNLQQA